MRTHGEVVRRQAKGGREHAGERSERARRNEQAERSRGQSHSIRQLGRSPPQGGFCRN